MLQPPHLGNPLLGSTGASSCIFGDNGRRRLTVSQPCSLEAWERCLSTSRTALLLLCCPCPEPPIRRRGKNLTVQLSFLRGEASFKIESSIGASSQHQGLSRFHPPWGWQIINQAFPPSLCRHGLPPFFFSPKGGGTQKGGGSHHNSTCVILPLEMAGVLLIHHHADSVTKQEEQRHAFSS